MLLDHDEPTNYEEAMMSLDSAKWLEAMKYEMGSMYENKVWTFVVVFSRGVQDDICHKVASCEGKTVAGISRDG